MHPAIRIVTLVVFAAVLARGGLSALLLAVLLLLVLYGTLGVVQFQTLWRMVKRMRWLFASLAVIYLWFTPGDPLVSALGPASPSMQGMQAGALRIGLLIALVAAVNLLLQSTDREQLLSGLYWLARPLEWIGFSRERLAVRMVLVLETVPHLQSLIQADRPDLRGRNAVRLIGEAAGQYFRTVLDKAEQAACGPIEVPEGRRPPAYQWLYPLGLGLLFWMTP